MEEAGQTGPLFSFENGITGIAVKVDKTFKKTPNTADTTSQPKPKI
jgi:hypothetical protein